MTLKLIISAVLIIDINIDIKNIFCQFQ